MKRIMLKIFPAETSEDIETVKTLFVEYEEFLPFDLSFQNFDDEVANISGRYAAPEGCLLLAEYQGHVAGCVGLQRLSGGICEMRRLFVRLGYQGSGIGKALCKAVIEQAVKIGYTHMRLCTALEPPKALYKSIGFKKIEPYKHVPIETAVFMELKLE